MVVEQVNREFLYTGSEHGITAPTKVLLRAVGKAGAMFEPDEAGQAGYLRSDLEISRHGSLQPGDTAFVHPWNSRKGRWSFVEIDLPAEDLEPI